MVAPLLPEGIEILEYDLMLTDSGVQRSDSMFQSPVVERIVGARLWQVRLTLHARNREGDRNLVKFLQNMAGNDFRLTYPRLDPQLDLNYNGMIDITGSQLSGERQTLTLSGNHAEAGWLGKLIELNGRTAMVVGQAGATIEVFPHIPVPALPYTLSNPGGFVLRPLAPGYPALVQTATGVQPQIFDCVESP